MISKEAIVNHKIIDFKHTMWIWHAIEPSSHSEMFSERRFNRLSKAQQLKSLKNNVKLVLPLSRDFGDLTNKKGRETSNARGIKRIKATFLCFSDHTEVIFSSAYFRSSTV